MERPVAYYMQQARAAYGVAQQCAEGEEQSLWLRIAGDWARLAGATREPAQLDDPPGKHLPVNGIGPR
jgi:hypothetical protein